jgi:hypothetical protein
MESAITKQWVLIPAGLSLNSLSASIRNLAKTYVDQKVELISSYKNTVLTLHFKIRIRLLYDELQE